MIAANPSPSSSAEQGASVDWAGRPLIPGDWRELHLHDALPLLLRFALISGDARAKALFIEHWPSRVRAMRPGFYPGWVLVEVQARLADASMGLCNFLYGPLGQMLVDGTSAPIHALNAHGVLAIQDDAAAADYLRFFCSAVHGDDGRFQIIEHLDALAYLAGVDGGVQPGGPADGLGIEPLDIRRDGDKYLASATVLYGTELFEAQFSVGLDGLIEMVDDTALAAVRVRSEEFRSPFRILRPIAMPNQ